MQFSTAVFRIKSNGRDYKARIVAKIYFLTIQLRIVLIQFFIRILSYFINRSTKRGLYVQDVAQ